MASTRSRNDVQAKGVARSDSHPPRLLLAGLAPLPAKQPALGFVLTAPDAILLIGLKGELEAGTLHRAGPAEGFGCLEFGGGGPGAPRGKEQVGVDAPTGGEGSPVINVSFAERLPTNGHQSLLRSALRCGRRIAVVEREAVHSRQSTTSRA